MTFLKLISALIVSNIVIFAPTNVLAALTEAEKADYYEALKDIDFDAVRQDIRAMMTDSQSFYPADYGHYGPFMIRMAWHCAGTYRQSDGEGGCEGGRQRFDPERSWADNTNLDKARRLLEPIKEKYGLGLSWGDLMTLTGTEALEMMGTPSLGFCAGRVDDEDGTDSLVLGTTAEQMELTPCVVNGDCKAPFGAALLDHIYVNPGGFLGNPDPAGSVDIIRDVFGRMGMNDTETVALIGGGHTFGKMHGSCAAGPGQPPSEAGQGNGWPFPNSCGNKASDITTSGYEGAWSSQPLQWTTNYFNILVDNEWELEQSPSGQNQFRSQSTIPAPDPDGSLEDTLNMRKMTHEVKMLVTDVSLVNDNAYKQTVQDFADDIEVAGHQFAHAWYKLMTRDMGPVSRCFGDRVPDAQEFQAPLPEPYSIFPELEEVEKVYDRQRDRIQDQDRTKIMEGAFLCAATFRESDHFGGCDGGRVFNEPEASWPARKPLKATLATFVQDLELDVSKADFLVFGATKMLQDMLPEDYDGSFSFCPLRSDVPEGEYQQSSESVALWEYENKGIQHRRHKRLLNLNWHEYVALMGRPRGKAYMHSLGYSGGFTNSSVLSNDYVTMLLNTEWMNTTITGIFGHEHVSPDGMYFMTDYDLALGDEPAFADALQNLLDEEMFLDSFVSGWTKLMMADRFDGPVENLCTNGKIEVIELGIRTAAASDDDFEAGTFFGIFFGSILSVAALFLLITGVIAILLKVKA